MSINHYVWDIKVWLYAAYLILLFGKKKIKDSMDKDNQRLPLCIAVHLSLVTTLSQNNNKNMHAVVDPQFA